MKKYLIRCLLPYFMDLLIKSSHRLARKSGSTVDDLVSGALMAEKNKIIDDIRANL